VKQVFLQKGRAILQEVSVPKVGKNDVLVKVAYSFISSGTEGATVVASGQSLLRKFLNNSKEAISKIQSSINENGILGTYHLIANKSKQVLEVGYSCSGEVVEVGENVEHIKVGDFVTCAGAGGANHAQYVSVSKNLVVKLRDDK
jgi:NADPH:quinone reductase-like Zn-dependent oxidoreductase